MDARKMPPMPSVEVRLFCDIDDAAPNLETGDVEWPSGDGGTAAYTFVRDEMPWVCVNVARMLVDGTPLETVLSILAHEAVHCAYRHFESITEEDPGEEEMAYHVEAFSRMLFESFTEWLDARR